MLKENLDHPFRHFFSPNSIWTIPHDLARIELFELSFFEEIPKHPAPDSISGQRMQYRNRRASLRYH